MDDLLSVEVLYSFQDCEKEVDSWERMEAVFDVRVYVAKFLVFERLHLLACISRCYNSRLCLQSGHAGSVGTESS